MHRTVLMGSVLTHTKRECRVLKSPLKIQIDRGRRISQQCSGELMSGVWVEEKVEIRADLKTKTLKASKVQYIFLMVIT